MIAALMATPAVIAARLTAKPAAEGVVRQSELQRAVDLQNQLETTVFRIRERIEAGAQLEHGSLGVSTVGHERLQWFRDSGVGETDSIDSVAGLVIAPVEQIQEDRAGRRCLHSWRRSSHLARANP
jgi:hypothetical protein